MIAPPKHHPTNPDIEQKRNPQQMVVARSERIEIDRKKQGRRTHNRIDKLASGGEPDKHPIPDESGHAHHRYQQAP